MSFDTDALGTRVCIPSISLAERNRSERTSDCEVQIHTLDASLALDLHETGSRPVERDALLQDSAKVAGTDPVAHLRELQRARVAFHGAHEDRFALVGGEARRQRRLDVAECTRADASV